MQRLKIPRYIQWIVLSGIIFLLLMTLLRAALLLVFQRSDYSSSELIRGFILGLSSDRRMVCIASVVFLILGMIRPLHPLDKKLGQKVTFSLWIIIIIGFTLFYAVDFANYAYLSQHVTATVLNYLGDARISMRMIWESYPVVWVTLALIAMIFLLITILRRVYNHVLSRPKNSTKKTRIIWSIVFFLLFALGIFGRLGQYPLRWSDAFGHGSDLVANVSLNPFESFFSTLEFKSSTYDLERTKAAYGFMSDYLGVDHPDINTLNFDRTVTAKADTSNNIKPNVVLVICESFSGYKSSMYGNPLNTTPYFNRLCENGIFFDRYFTPTYGTARGVWATITGIPDVQLVNTSSRNPATVNQHTIMNDFKGYEKYYFIGGSTSWANIRGLLKDNIDSLHLFEQDDYKAPKLDVWGISDKNLLLEANKKLAQAKDPFFAVIQTADNHRPYSIPEEDQKEFKRLNVPGDTLKKYGFDSEDEYNAFRYTDFCFEKFIEAAKKENYFKNTIFVFTGDHGIPGDAGDMFPQAWTKNRLTCEHVPFLIYAPGMYKPQRYSFLASQIDIMPTIAGLCNVSYTNTAMGRNLLDEKKLADSGKGNAVFILDMDQQRIGIIHDDLYYSYGINNSSPQSIVSVANNNVVNANDSLLHYYRKLTDDFYATANYLLFNNKKR
jgi:phosphoglycerol transferase MdoB-like AlkP superfamily enzyme